MNTARIRSTYHAASHLLSRGFSLAIGFALFLPAVVASGTAFAPSRGYSGTQIMSTAGGDKDQGEPNHCGEPGGASSWFFFLAPRNGVMEVDTQGSSFDTVLAVYIGPGTSFDTLTNLTCNNDSSPGQIWSKIVFNVSSNTLYYIAVDGVGGASGKVKLNYSVGDPLLITQQPQGLVRSTGTSSRFTVTATGTASLRYQWFHNGAPMTGSTQAVLNLPAAQLAHEGAYVVRVEDAVGQVQSLPASLIVCPRVPPTNALAMSALTLNGARCLRLVGHAGVGSVLEATEDLIQWTTLPIAPFADGLFAVDDLQSGPRRYFRIRLAP